MLKSWAPGAGVVAVRNPHYWNPSVHPLIGQITIKGVPDIASLTAGLLTNAVRGVYATNDSTLNQLERSSNVKVYLGPGWTTDALAVASLEGVLGNLKGRTITIGTTSQLAVYAGDTGAYQAAAQAIGLKVVLKSVSAQDWLRDALAVRRAQATSAMPSCAAYGRCRPPSAA